MEHIFLGTEALAGGAVTRHALSHWYRRIYPDVYLPKLRDVSLHDRAVAAWLWSRRQAVITGVVASALHGACWVGPDHIVELNGQTKRPPGGLIVRNQTLAPDEVTAIGQLPVTTLARTAYDLARHLPRGQALARLDALMHAKPFPVDGVTMLAGRYPGARGVRQLRELLPVVDGGAASPKETWLRLLLIDAGFPIPTTQIPVLNGDPWPYAYLDMGWQEFKVAAEYDGDQHRTDRAQYVRDHRRQRVLSSLSWINVQVIAEDRAQDIINRVDRALRSRGWDGKRTPRVPAVRPRRWAA